MEKRNEPARCGAAGAHRRLVIIAFLADPPPAAVKIAANHSHKGIIQINGLCKRTATIHGSDRTYVLGQKQQAVWKKFGNPVSGPASNLAVVHEIILSGVV